MPGARQGASPDAIRRALSEDVGDNLLDLGKRTRQYADPFGSDARVFAIHDWDSEAAFREALFLAPELVDNPVFRHMLGTFRESELVGTIGRQSDVLTLLSLVNPERSSDVVPGEDLSPAEDLLGFFVREGSDRAGNVVEMVGPSGSGKSSKTTWWTVRNVERGIPVCADYHVTFPEASAPLFAEKHRSSEAIAWLARTRRRLDSEGHLDTPIWWVLDEQGTNLGGSSLGASTLEGRWSSGSLAQVRKIGVNVLRARQADNVPHGQESWVTVLVRTTRDSLDVLRGSFTAGARRGERFAFRVPRMADRFDTHKPASIDYDLDMEELARYSSRYEATQGIAEIWERFATAWAGGRNLFDVEFGETVAGAHGGAKPQLECADCGRVWTPRTPGGGRCPGCGSSDRRPVEQGP